VMLTVTAGHGICTAACHGSRAPKRITLALYAMMRATQL